MLLNVGESVVWEGKNKGICYLLGKSNEFTHTYIHTH